MNRRIQMLALIVIVSFFCFGFEGILLKDYKTENQDEKEILATLIGYEEAYNKHDAEKCLSYLCDEGRFRPGGAITKFSKKEYAVVLPSDFDNYESRIDYNPKITISGDKAYVDLQSDISIYTVDYKYTLKKEKDKWLILETDYRNARYKE